MDDDFFAVAAAAVGDGDCLYFVCAALAKATYGHVRCSNCLVDEIQEANRCYFDVTMSTTNSCAFQDYALEFVAAAAEARALDFDLHSYHKLKSGLAGHCPPHNYFDYFDETAVAVPEDSAVKWSEALSYRSMDC